jgi:D-amino peptidase
MRVVLSADMEGIAQIGDVREIGAGCRAYWETGRARMNADVAAAAAGLLAGGAREVIVLDNHGSGNPFNLLQEALPESARLETWNVFELAEHGVQAMLQVGYHARCGVDGFLSHSYIPRLRLRVNDELIGETHGRAWAAGVPLLGIVGNSSHKQTLGSLAGTPFLVVQESQGRDRAMPVHDPDEGLVAITEFAERAMRDADAAPPIAPPSDVAFGASLPADAGQAEVMVAAGWTRTGETEFEVHLPHWRHAREPLAAAMNAALAPFVPYFDGLDLSSAEAAGRQDPERLRALEAVFVGWATEPEEDWLSAGAEPARG